MVTPLIRLAFSWFSTHMEQEKTFIGLLKPNKNVNKTEDPD